LEIAVLLLCFSASLLPPRFARPPGFCDPKRRYQMTKFAWSLWKDQEGQDIAEYAVMLAVILVIVVGTIRLVGSNANNVFSSVASSVK
jgi:Flp pilus assembly pilin Flp